MFVFAFVFIFVLFFALAFLCICICFCFYFCLCFHIRSSSKQEYCGIFGSQRVVTLVLGPYLLWCDLWRHLRLPIPLLLGCARVLHADRPQAVHACHVSVGELTYLSKSFDSRKITRRRGSVHPHATAVAPSWPTSSSAVDPLHSLMLSASMVTVKVYFSDGDSCDLCDDDVEMKRQMDRLEPGGFDKYNAYLDSAQLNLEVKGHWMRPGAGVGMGAAVAVAVAIDNQLCGRRAKGGESSRWETMYRNFDFEHCKTPSIYFSFENQSCSTIAMSIFHLPRDFQHSLLSHLVW